MLEEVDIRMSESKRDTRDFKKDVVVGGENPRTGRTSTEKFVKYTSRAPHRTSTIVFFSVSVLLMCYSAFPEGLDCCAGSWRTA